MKSKRDVIQSDSEEEDVPESVDETYYVEVITHARVRVDKDFEYRVKWWSYPESDNTWEPYENVENCKRLLKSFWKEVGKEHYHNPGPVGELYAASEAWIEKEKKKFKKEYEEKEKEMKANKELKEEKPPKEAAKLKSNERMRDETRGHNNAPSTSTSAARVKSTLLRKPVVEISDDESEDDKPLRKRVSKGQSHKTTSEVKKRKSISMSLSESEDEKDQPKGEHTAFQTRKYSSMKINKVSRSGASALLNTRAPPLTAEDINLHRRREIIRPPVEEIDFRKSDVYEALFLPSNSQKHEPATENPPLDMDGAENFLETISSRGAAAALKPAELAKADAFKSSLRPFFKKWIWDGELFVKTDEDFADRWCNIRLEDVTDISEDGFKFDVLMDGKDSIRFDYFYHPFQIRTILRGLRRVDQFASICHAGPEDRDSLMLFKSYMRNNRLAVRTPVVTDFGHVAEMIAFPVESELSGLLRVPLSLTNHATFIVALMPLVVPPSSFKPFGRLPCPEKDRRVREEIDDWTKDLAPTLATPLLIDSLELLSFPRWLINMTRNKQYCIWARDVDPPPKDSGKTFGGNLRPETSALINVLTSLDATNVGYKKDLYFVFVHIGALTTLNALEALAERRCKRPEIRFFTYGRHACAKPTAWGIQEIYPLGGVVTFTHAALLEDPFGTANLMMKLEKHPLWTAYLLPSVLSVFVRRASYPDNPNEIFSKEPFRFGRVLHLIDEGLVSLTESPSLREQPESKGDKSPSDKWMTAQLLSITKSQADVIQECWLTYISRFSKQTDSEVTESIQAEIEADLRRLQVQPRIRAEYRRYVVIKAESEKNIPWDRGGFEWETTKTFNFRDDFHGRAPPPKAPARNP